MMKTIIISTLLVVSTFATLSVNFHEHDIDENVFVIGSDKKAQSISINEADSIYLATVKVNSASQEAIFDTTIGQNWQYQADQNPDIDGELTVQGFNDRLVLEQGKVATLKEVEINGEHLKNVVVVKSNHLDVSSNPALAKAVSFGFGLDRNEQTNFLSVLKQNNVKLERQGFSFHVSQKINQVMFGGPEEFFANGKLHEVPLVKKEKDDARWVAAVAEKSISLKGADALSQTTSTYAILDSTTRYIWAEDQLVDSLVQELNNKGLQCVDVNTSNHAGVYNCNDNQLPPLNIGFTDKQGKVQNFQLSNYAESTGKGATRLLVRKSATYSNKKEALEVPELEDSKTVSNIVLGTIFFENVYTYFDAENDHIELAQAFQSEPQNAFIASGARLWYLILGGVLLLAALAALLFLIKEVPYTASSQSSIPTKAIAHQVVPQGSIVQQQPVLLQSYVRSVQPQSYYVQNQQPVILSPTRVYQTQYVPK